jgi:hypothetical protein
LAGGHGHGNATEHREQTEAEGTHASVGVRPIVRKATYDMRARHTKADDVEGVKDETLLLG